MIQNGCDTFSGYREKGLIAINLKKNKKENKDIYIYILFFFFFFKPKSNPVSGLAVVCDSN